MAVKNFTIKDGILLCLFLTGLRFSAEVLLFLLHVRFDLIYDAVFLTIVILIARRLGRTAVRNILRYRPVSVYVFSSLSVMFMGLKIIGGELLNLLQFALPVPEGYFGTGLPGNIVLAVISTAVFPAFTEEIFFRGLLLNQLRSGYSSRRALILSSLLFGLMHLNPWQFLYSFVLGLFYGWIYVRFKNIWLSMFMHFYNNLLALFLVLPVVQLPNRRSYAILVRHPLWLDILGVLLFLAGLGLTVQLARPLKPKESPRGPPHLTG
jgi:membrane protease YdiL (CAAX protease family)